jgi:hypothetical protein
LPFPPLRRAAQKRAGAKGFGLFAGQDLKAGQFVIEYLGEVLEEEEYHRRKEYFIETGQRHYYFMNVGNGEVIDASRRGNLGRFINHSCEPNCETQKWVAHGELAIGLFTLDDIPAGAELTFDYNFERYGDKVRAVRCGWGGGAKHLRGSAVRHRWVSMAAAGCGGLQRQRRLGRGGERGAGGGGCCSGGGCLAGGCRQHARPHPSWRVPFSIRVCSLTGLLFPGLGPCPCPPSSP